MKKILNTLFGFFGTNKENKEPKPKRTNNLESAIKFWFRTYFEGDFDMHILPQESININNFGITKIEFKYESQAVEMVLHIQRPGLLIGKGGHTIDGVKNFISKSIGIPVTISLIEKNIWK